jgi:mRNA-degrading endonuclease toxin of MazEF toxin-antitoxin module
MAARTAKGEVWLVDLGMVAKVRPCLVLSIPNDMNSIVAPTRTTEYLYKDVVWRPSRFTLGRSLQEIIRSLT